MEDKYTLRVETEGMEEASVRTGARGVIPFTV